jgi:hypothetical protein
MTLTSVRDSARAPTIPDVLAEHLEELGFLSLQRRKLLFAEDVTARQLARHEQRIEAHWAGLCVSPEDAVEMAKVRLEDPVNAWEVMACARTWVALGDPKAAEILESLNGSNEMVAAGWREALRRMPAEIGMARFSSDPDGTHDPTAYEILLDAFSWHSLLPPHRAAAAATSPNDRARFAVARHSSAPELLETLARDPNERVRRAARWSRLLLNPVRELERLRAREIEEAKDPFVSLFCSLLEEPRHSPEDEAQGEAPREPTMSTLWRRAVLTGKDPHGIRREVPDGFFDGELADEAIAGE